MSCSVAFGVIRRDHGVTNRSISQPQPSPPDSTPAAHRCLGAEKDLSASSRRTSFESWVEYEEDGEGLGDGQGLVVLQGAI